MLDWRVGSYCVNPHRPPGPGGQMRAPWLAVLAILAPVAVVRAQEMQALVEEAGRIQVITAELASRLELFAGVSAFREARLFVLPDSTFVLELTSSPRGSLQ